MKILAIDLGDARTGVAVCDEGELLARPLTVLHEHAPERLLQGLVRLAQEERAALIVLGNPRNMDGSLGERARRAAELAPKLAEAAGVPVELWDERLTTVQAHQLLNATNTRGAKRKATVDAVAATLILESYLNRRKNAREKA